jgi:lipopolysaccharide export system permease protein
MRKTTYFYILKETIPIFLIGLLIFTIILLMDKIFKLIELVVNRGGSITNILMIFLFISPSFLVLTIPVSVLLGILLSFGRLSGDSEITAFKASGISLYELFIPIIVFSIGAFLITSSLVFYGLPWGNRGFISTLYVMAQSKPDVEIKERVFNDMFDGLVVYVDKVPVQGKKMEGILIYDERDKSNLSTIFAKEGFLMNNPESQEIILRLSDGNIHRFEWRTNTYQKVKFDHYDLKIELTKAFIALGKKPRLRRWNFISDMPFPSPASFLVSWASPSGSNPTGQEGPTGLSSASSFYWPIILPSSASKCSLSEKCSRPSWQVGCPTSSLVLLASTF